MFLPREVLIQARRAPTPTFSNPCARRPVEKGGGWTVDLEGVVLNG